MMLVQISGQALSPDAVQMITTQGAVASSSSRPTSGLAIRFAPLHHHDPAERVDTDAHEHRSGGRDRQPLL